MEHNLRIFPWNKELETNIEIVDQHHKEFLKQANKFIIKVLAGKTEEAVEEEFEFIKDYLLYHFQVEETFQYESGYPEYKLHQAEHLQMKFKTKALEVAINNKNEGEVDIFVSYINDVIVNHMLDWDLKFIQYYNETHRA